VASTGDNVIGLAPVEAFQNEWELRHMLAIVNELAPRRVLEVGCWHGGTLWHWLNYGGRVVAVDDAMRLESEWREWAVDTGSDLHLLRGLSQDEPIIQRAGELGPYDFIFIDADHRYDAVRADWDSYSPMLAPGGLVGFHDTVHPDPTYGVGRLWAELTAEPDVHWMHIAQTGHCGIGLLWP
jgi:cephalosporin hydroxylase